MSAREDFVSSIKAVSAALILPELQDGPPTDVAHNRRAQVARAGLAVVSFSLVERFLRDRSAEVTDWIRRQRLPAGHLSDPMRVAATAGALRSVMFQADLRRRNGEDPTPYIQQQVSLVHEASTVIAFAEPAFFHGKPNINGEDVADVLKTFGVQSGWQKIERFARRAGSPALSAADAFKNAASRRHAAAHQGGPPLPSGDLTSFLTDSVGICLGFDALFGRAAQLFCARDPAYLANGVDEASIAIRFVDQSADGWFRERGPTARALARNRDLEQLLRHTVPRAITGREFIVIRGSNGVPLDWRCCDLP